MSSAAGLLRPSVLSVVALVLALGCGEGVLDTPDAGLARDAAGPDAPSIDATVEHDASIDDDAAIEGDAGIEGDAAIDVDAAVEGDASIGGDASIDPDGGTLGCVCDVSVLCDEGCACDIACSVVPTAPPLGDDALLLDRAEIAIYYPSAAGGSIDRVTLRDDAFTGPGGPSPAYRALVAPTARPAMTVCPVTLASDVDDDGRDEVVRVDATSVIVEDWSGTALTPRTVRTHPAATSFDAAAGDLDGDGGRDLVVSRQTGTTVTIEVLALGATGSATVRASTTISSASRHAITIGRASAGAVPEIYALIGTTGSSGAIEPMRARRFALSGAALVEGTALDVGGECLGDATRDEGMAIAVGNLDADPASEIVTAVYCTDGSDFWVKAHDPGSLTRRWIGSPSLESHVAEARAERPFLTLGRVGTTARSPLMIVVGTTIRGGSFGAEGPVAQVSVLELRPDRLQSYTSRQLGDFDLSVLTGLAVRDLDRDGTDEIVAGYVDAELTSGLGGPCEPWDFCTLRERDAVAEVHERELWADPTELVRIDASGADDLGPGVAVAAGDLDADSTRVRATGNVFLHTGRPFVNAVLAAPPTWRGRAGTAHTPDSETSFGTAMSMGTSETRTINASASVTVSASASFGPLVEFSSSVTASAEYASSSTLSESVSFGTQTSVGDDADLVLFRAVPYASYEYEVVSHPIAAEIGSLMTIDVPGTMIETVRTLTEFRAEYGAEADQVIPPGVLTHTVGDPSTYPASSACTSAAIGARIGTGTVSQARPSPTLVDVGNATSGARTQTMSISMQTGSATEISLSVSMSVGVGAGGVSVEASAGIGTSSTHETTVGRDVSYSGSVGYLATGYGIDTRYEWGLCVFHFTSPQYGSYPVVDYVVRRY